MALEGTFNPDCQNFKILIGDDNPRDAPERRQARLDVVSCFKQSSSRYIAKERDLGYSHNLKTPLSCEWRNHPTVCAARCFS